MRSLGIFSVIVTGFLGGCLATDAAGQAAGGPKPDNATLVYIGTHTGAKSKGIYLFRLQPTGTEVFQNVTLVPLGLAAETPNPTYFELDLKRRLLYTVNEVEGGAVSAFSIDSAGKLTLLNQQPSRGKKPCHLALDREGRNLLVANCGGGGVAVLPVQPDGRLREPSDVVASPDVPGVTLDQAGRFAILCDARADRILTYRFDAERGKLSPAEPAFTALKAGSGPRRVVFRPDGRFAYVVNERNSTITAFSYDGATGRLTEIQTVSTLPGYWEGTNTTAEPGMHPSGKYLFASNLGHNSVVLYSIDPDAGTLNWIEEQGTGGRNPVHFGIEPSAKHLAIANRDSDTVLAARIDAGNGRLKPSGIFAEVPSPACVRFLPPAGE